MDKVRIDDHFDTREERDAKAEELRQDGWEVQTFSVGSEPPLSFQLVASRRKTRTVREFLASGDKGHFAQQLERTHRDPCAANLRLLRAVADGPNQLALSRAMFKAKQYCFEADDYSAWIQWALEHVFPVLRELDREMTASDTTRLPREAAGA